MQKYNIRRAFTLVELIVTIVAALIVILGVVGIIANGHKGYRRLWNRENRGVVPEAYIARRAFDVIVRKSSIEDEHISANEAYVYYFDARNADGTVDIDALRALIQPNRYARFYLAGGDLNLDRGPVPTGTNLSLPAPPSLTPDQPVKVLASNVGSCVFARRGNSIQMILTLDNETSPSPGASKIETLKMTVTTTAVRHGRANQQ